MKLKKSILLFATVALGGMLGASADDIVFQSYEDIYTFDQDWKSESIPTSSYLDCRQGFGQNNQFLIQNKNANYKKIMIYDQTGYVGDFAESGSGSNFTKDDAGNILVRPGTFNRPYSNAAANGIMLIKADKSQTVTVYLPTESTSYTPRVAGHYWGFAEGDVFSPEGGRLLFTGSGLTYFIVLDIKNGAISSGTRVEMPFLFGSAAEMKFSIEDVINAWKDANGKHHYLVVHRSENPIDITLDENNNPTATTINTHAYSNYGSSNGTNAFTLNGKNYIMFTTQPNYNDGFVIAELGTNADGTLDGTVNVVAQHEPDYTEAISADNSLACNWLNWEPRDSKSIYVYQYFPGYYMARYIFGIKTDETTLADIVNDGEVDQTYTVADDILGVYIAVKDPTRVYAKDYGKHRNPSIIKDGEVDALREEVNLQSGDWDQSNWVLLDFGSTDEAQKYVGKVIKGGTLTGVLTDKLNPAMTVTQSTEPTQEQDYEVNNYIGCNFMDPNVQTDAYWNGRKDDFFFVKPKPQEYAMVNWAMHDRERHFTIVTTSSDLKGSFNADWSLYPDDWQADFVIGKAYNFHAIVRYVQGSKVGASEGNYLVFPLEGGPNVVTAVNDVTARREVASVTYVNMQGMQSATPFEGINIVVTKYTNGETQVAKQLR
ncbi:MAG: hypothetical protein II683_07120 [Muribaculaceae bacterium]|nr:hypothetical protein [Muribaculaceae bacterium]